MRLKLALVAALVMSPAMADTNIVYASFGPAAAGPDPVVLMMPMRTDENHNVLMMANAIDPAGVKSVTIIGNGKVLAACPAAICNFVWARTAMRSGQNTVIMRAVNSAGVTRDAPGYYNKPAAP